MKITSKGFAEFAKRLTDKEYVHGAFATAIRNSVTAITAAVKENLNSEGINSTGTLSRSVIFTTNPTVLEGRVGIRAPGASYGADVERGTGPHYVSPNALRRWAQSKGLNEYAVAKSIAKKGTKAHPFFVPAYKSNKPFIKKQFDQASQRAVKHLAGK